MTAALELIVSADDFGMSPGVNAAIIDAHRNGILTNTSLMVNGAAVDEAAALAAENPSLGVGLHLVLVQGHATLSREEIPDLVDASGRFDDQPVLTGIRYYFQPRIREQLRREVEAQVEKLIATGVRPSHIDGHLNIHMHPAVLPIVLDVATRHDIGAIRLTREAVGPALRYDRTDAGRKFAEAAVFSALARLASVRAREKGIAHADSIYGLHQTGQVSEDYLLHIVETLQSGTTEIYCHPAVADEEATRWRPAHYRGDIELAALTSPRVRAAVARRGVDLVSYRELRRGQQS